jgi:hypothetical protein
MVLIDAIDEETALVVGTRVEPVQIEFVESSMLPDVFVREAVPPLAGRRVFHRRVLRETRKR